MSDLIKRDDALDILCKSCGISEDVEKCRKTSADGWCKEYCGLKDMPSVEAIPVEWLKEWAKTNDEFFEGELYAYLISTILLDWNMRSEK